jgi:MFS family permease
LQAPPVSVSGLCDAANLPLVLAAAILASSMRFIDGTAVAITIPAVRASLGPTLSQAQWVQDIYMLTLSALMMAGGKPGDRFGLARIFAA